MRNSTVFLVITIAITVAPHTSATVAQEYPYPYVSPYVLEYSYVQKPLVVIDINALPINWNHVPIGEAVSEDPSSKADCDNSNNQTESSENVNASETTAVPLATDGSTILNPDAASDNSDILDSTETHHDLSTTKTPDDLAALDSSASTESNLTNGVTTPVVTASASHGSSDSVSTNVVPKQLLDYLR